MTEAPISLLMVTQFDKSQNNFKIRIKINYTLAAFLMFVVLINVYYINCLQFYAG